MSNTINSPCIPAEGTPRANGYHQVQWHDESGRKRMEYAHRRAYREFYGVEIEPGNHVHHVCTNPACINPHHLQQVTPAEHRAIHRELRTVAA